MKPSSIVQEWIQQGIEQGIHQGEQHGTAILRSWVLRSLQRRFGGDIPADLRTQIDAQTDLAVLDRWFDLALEAASLDQFRAGLPPQANGQ